MSQLFNLSLVASITLVLNVFFSSPASYANDTEQPPIDVLPFFIYLAEGDNETSFFFSSQNSTNYKTLLSIMELYNPTETVIPFLKKNKNQHILKASRKKTTQPIIEYRKINPTKYRLRIHEAEEEFFLVFSETFHKRWKVYLVPLSNSSFSPDSLEIQQQLKKYKIFKYNEKHQSSLEDLKSFLEKGWISSLGSKKDKSSQLLHELGTNSKEVKYRETFKIDFISKNYKGTIQNDNLNQGQTWETWFGGGFIDTCQNDLNPTSKCSTLEPNSWEIRNGSNPTPFVWPEKFHFQVNGYANSWWINTNLIKKMSALKNEGADYIKVNPNGKIDFEIIIEFWPQRIYYLGWTITAVTLAIILIALLVQRILHKSSSRTSTSQFS
mgnify:CR=1 FL=1